MIEGDFIKKVRAEIARRNGGDEFSAVKNNESLSELRKKIQDLKLEMVEAKKLALKKVHEEYTATITEVEREYALMLKLSA